MKVDFNEWLPDQPDYQNPGMIEAKNVLPYGRSYGSIGAVNGFTSALTSACLGGYWHQSSAGTITNFAGDNEDLYRLLSDDTYTSVGTTSYSTAVNWDFTSFGDRVIAVDIANAPQFYDVGSSTVFDNLPGSPPKAKYVATIRDFVVLGNINDGAAKPNAIEWSGFNNSEIWTASLATQQSQKVFQGDGGAVQRVVPGEYGVVFQEQSIWRMDYVGPPTVFNFDEVERNKGAFAPNSVVWWGQRIWFYDRTGFFFFDGQSTTPIGNERVDRWFRDNSDFGSRQTMVGALDRVNQVVKWAFKTDSALTYNDRMIIYSFAANRWSWAEIETEYLIEYASPTQTLDDLDGPLPLGLDSYDPLTVDTTRYQGGVISLMAFNSSNIGGRFDGNALAATVVSGEQSFDRNRFETTSIRPLVEGDDVTVTTRVGYRDRLTTSVTYSTSKSVNAIGTTDHRINNRYQRFRVDTTGTFNHIEGVEVIGREAGRR